MSDTVEQVAPKKRVTVGKVIQYSIAAVALPITITPLAFMLVWEVTEKPVRAVIKRFGQTDWNKVGDVMGLIGQDISKASAKVLPKPIHSFLGRGASESARALSGFTRAMHNSGPWGGFPASLAFFGAIVGISVAATAIKIPLLINFGGHLPDITLESMTWLVNHSSILANGISNIVNSFLYPVHTLASHWNYSFQLPEFRNFNFVAPHFPPIGKYLSPYFQSYFAVPLQKYAPSLYNVLATVADRLTPDPNRWWDLSQWVSNNLPYGSKLAPYLSPVTSTYEALEKATIALVVSAKAVKVVAAPLYLWFPHMTNYWPYKATKTYLHVLGDAIKLGAGFAAVPVRVPVKAIARATKAVASVTLAPAWNLAKSILPANSGQSSLVRMVTRVLTSPVRIPVAATHRYFQSKINHVGGVLKPEGYVAPVYDRTVSGDLKKFVENPRDILRQWGKNITHTIPTLVTLAASGAGGAYAFAHTAPLIFHAAVAVPFLGAWPIVGAATSGIFATALASIPAAVTLLGAAAVTKYIRDIPEYYVGSNEPQKVVTKSLQSTSATAVADDSIRQDVGLTQGAGPLPTFDVNRTRHHHSPYKDGAKRPMGFGVRGYRLQA